MPSATARRVYEDQIPPFMTVFDLDAETMADRETVTVVQPKFVDSEPKAPTFDNCAQHTLRPANMLSIHKHHDGASLRASESADSSPTTTLSTTDSSPLSDPSPSSSPDSPVNLIPLNNFPSTTFGMLADNSLSTSTLGVAHPGFLQRPMTSPSPRRPRNMKGLSIQPPFAAATSTSSMLSEPSSPSFIKPKIPGMKRKPSQLSLKTNTNDLITKTTLEVPSSPAMPPILQRRALKHSTSSPHMLSGLKSSTFGPAGGMTFPKVLERNENGLSEVLRPMKTSMNTTFDTTIAEEDSPIRTQIASRFDFEPYHERENNEDQKSPGYPDGPVAIYGDNVWLYLEPTADEAARFDVVINVAREVHNPFDKTVAERKRQQQQKSTAGDESPVPDTAISNASFATAFEYPPDEDQAMDTPTTPKATSTFKTPEYIHMPWDHNTDIASDLMHLCEIIDNRTKQGLRVLIHCQQGASRSASLIIAYGLYQKPEMSVNDAYYAAQAKSRWISPNMKLMYSLQDFQKDLSKRRLPPASALKPRTGRSPSKHRLTLSADAIDIGPKEPQTAPLPANDGDSKNRSPAPSPNRLRGNSTPGCRPVLLGPASAPPTSSTWTGMSEESIAENRTSISQEQLPERPKSGSGRPPPSLLGPAFAPQSLAPSHDPWGRPPPSPAPFSHASFGFQSMTLPRFISSASYEDEEEDDHVVEKTVAVSPQYPDDEALLSPRAETMTSNPLHDFSEVAGMRFVESPPTPNDGLFSPRASMFPRDPFSPFAHPTQVEDPRSPPTKGEAPIIRSIDDIL